MFQMILQTTRGKWAVALIVLAIIGAINSLSNHAFDVQESIGTAELLIVAVLLIISVVKTINTPASEYWRKWESVPMNEAQIRRLERGLECGFTPRKINIDAKYAIIVGSERNAYKTTLRSCTCPDFAKRKLPCKHMYFLAIQTGAIDKNGNVMK